MPSCKILIFLSNLFVFKKQNYEDELVSNVYKILFLGHKKS